MHRCTVACFGHEQRQGRGCECDTNAGRFKLGLPPLHTNDGGHSVAGALSFPIEREEDDIPLITPESAESAWALVQDVLAFIIIALLALAGAAVLSKGAP